MLKFGSKIQLKENIIKGNKTHAKLNIYVKNDIVLIKSIKSRFKKAITKTPYKVGEKDEQWNKYYKEN
jgi:hypothetical protein